MFKKYTEDGEAISPYSAQTLQALQALGRDVRGVCRAMEAMETPARLHERLARTRGRLKTLRKQLAADHSFKIVEAVADISRGGVPAGTLGALLRIGTAAALAVAIVYGLGL